MFVFPRRKEKLCFQLFFLLHRAKNIQDMKPALESIYLHVPTSVSDNRNLLLNTVNMYKIYCCYIKTANLETWFVRIAFWAVSIVTTKNNFLLTFTVKQ